jgi:hypothetical protein
VHLPAFLARKYPERRFGMVASSADATFRYFFGFGYSATCDQLMQMPAQDFQTGLTELRDTWLAEVPNFRLYSPTGEKHGYLYDSPLGNTRVGQVGLTDWLRGLVNGTPEWGHVPPP